MSQVQVDKVIAWLLSMLGTGYVYGATGWVCSKARREQQAAQYPEYASTILGTCAKWDGKVCHDCAQLIRKAMAQIGITLPSGATSQWKADVWAEKGTIDTLPKDKLCMLFRESGGKMQHVLASLGDGRVVDARGSSQGVMLTKLGDYKATHWAVPRGIYDNVTEEDKKMASLKVCRVIGGRLRLRSSASTANDSNHIMWIPEKAMVSVLEQQAPDGWAYVSYDGKTGFVVAQYIQDVESVPDAPGATQSPGATQTPGATVNVTLPKAVADALIEAFGDALGRG